MEMAPLLQVPKPSHKKQISIDTRVVQVVEETKPAWPLRTKLAPKIRVAVSREDASIMWAEPRDLGFRPLNWTRCKTILAYASVLLLTSISSALPLILSALNVAISTELGVSYFATIALTGVPILIGSFTSLGTAVLTRLLGRRGLLLGAAVCMLGSLIWNANIKNSYAQFLAARAIQGAGWGVVGCVTSESVRDIFANHKSPVFLEIFNMASTLLTWSSPFIASYLSTRGETVNWRCAFRPMVLAQSVSLFLIVFFTPETHLNCTTKTPVDDDSWLASPTLPPGTLSALQTTISSTNVLPPKGPCAYKTYFRSLGFPRPAPSCSKPRNLMLPLRALAAPSTILRTALMGPLRASTFGIASILALPVSVAPTFLEPRRIGNMFILPAGFAILIHSIFTTFSHFSSAASKNRQGFGGKVRGYVATPAILAGVSGIMAFGVYTCNRLSPILVIDATFGKTVAEASYLNQADLWIMSLTFGFLVAGSIGMGLATRPFYGGIFGGRWEDVGEGGQELRLRDWRKQVDEDEPEGKIDTDQEVSNLISTASSFYNTLLSGVFILAFPFWMNSQSDPSTSTAIGSSSTSSTTISTTKPIVSPMLVGLRSTSVALGNVALIVGIVAAWTIVHGGKDVERGDLKVLGISGGVVGADEERQENYDHR